MIELHRRPSALVARASSMAWTLALSACAGFVPQVGPDPEPRPAGRYVMLTTPIIAVGDT
jgi:hypothetical protein